MDKLSPERRSRNMAAIRSKDMRPEMTVRRLVRALGLRYRLHGKDLPGKPDLVFPSRRKVIFVHGCFWHLHSDPRCADARLPKSNQAYWTEKLARNVARGQQTQQELLRLGWQTLVIWECETKDEEVLRPRLRDFLARD